MAEESNTNIKNRGTGAGGANTNKNGLSYETLTDLSDRFTVIKHDTNHKKIIFNNSNIEFISTSQFKMFKYMDEGNKRDKSIMKAHGCKNPDECYINEETKTMFIIEKKFQQTAGSVCEKIQTPDFKIWQYQRTFPEYKIVYIYCLSIWFKTNCIAEIEYLKHKKIQMYWGNSETYKEDIINYMINYK